MMTVSAYPGGREQSAHVTTQSASADTSGTAALVTQHEIFFRTAAKIPESGVILREDSMPPLRYLRHKQKHSEKKEKLKKAC